MSQFPYVTELTEFKVITKLSLHLGPDNTHVCLEFLFVVVAYCFLLGHLFFLFDQTRVLILL